MRKQRAQEKIAIDTHKQEEEAQKKVAIDTSTSTESTRENSYWHNAQRNKAQKKVAIAQKKEQSTKAHSYCTKKNTKCAPWVVRAGTQTMTYPWHSPRPEFQGLMQYYSCFTLTCYTSSCICKFHMKNVIRTAHNNRPHYPSRIIQDGLHCQFFLS